MKFVQAFRELLRLRYVQHGSCTYYGQLILSYNRNAIIMVHVFSFIGLQKRSKKISSGAFVPIMECEDVIDSRKH